MSWLLQQFSIHSQTGSCIVILKVCCARSWLGDIFDTSTFRKTPVHCISEGHEKKARLCHTSFPRWRSTDLSLMTTTFRTGCIMSSSSLVLSEKCESPVNKHFTHILYKGFWIPMGLPQYKLRINYLLVLPLKLECLAAKQKLLLHNIDNMKTKRIAAAFKITFFFLDQNFFERKSFCLVAKNSSFISKLDFCLQCKKFALKSFFVA